MPSSYGVLRVRSLEQRLTSWAVIATGKHLFPFRTEKLSPLAPMVLGEQSPGRVGRRPFSSPAGPGNGARSRSEPLGGPLSSAELLAPVRVELAEPLDPLADGRVREEER